MRKLVFVLFILLLATSAWGATLQIKGTTNTDDAMIAYENAYNALDEHWEATLYDNNYGATTTGIVRWLVSAESDTVYLRFLIRPKNLSSLLPANANITAMSCSLYCSTNTTDGNVIAYRVLKPWVEGDENGTDNNDGDVTYADWASDGSEWETFGCMCGIDGGIDNSEDGADKCNDGGSADRLETAIATTNVTTVNTWYSWSIPTELAQGWYDGTYLENGIILLSTATAANTFFTSEYTTDATKVPRFFITYTVAAPTNTRRPALIKKMLK